MEMIAENVAQRAIDAVLGVVAAAAGLAIVLEHEVWRGGLFASSAFSASRQSKALRQEAGTPPSGQGGVPRDDVERFFESASIRLILSKNGGRVS